MTTIKMITIPWIGFAKGNFLLEDIRYFSKKHQVNVDDCFYVCKACVDEKRGYLLFNELKNILDFWPEASRTIENHIRLEAKSDGDWLQEMEGLTENQEELIIFYGKVKKC